MSGVISTEFRLLRKADFFLLRGRKDTGFAAKPPSMPEKGEGELGANKLRHRAEQWVGAWREAGGSEVQSHPPTYRVPGHPGIHETVSEV